MKHLPWLPPVWLARGLERLRAGLLSVHRSSTLPQVAMLELAMGAWLSQGLYAAAQLGIADALEPQPLTPAELAARLGADAQSLQRLLRALSQYGVFALRRDGRFAQTSLSRQLRKDAPGSLRGFVLFLGHPKHRSHWSKLHDTVRNGGSDLELQYGTTLFEHMCRDRELGEAFDDAMTSLSQLATEATLASYDFSRFGLIVDVGGGRGAKLASILRSTPSARGVLFDLPEVTLGAAPVLERLGVRDRVRIESGSFFERVPAGGDAYVLKHILHDWSDERASKILQTIRREIPRPGRLLVIEGVVPADARAHMAKLIDLEMLVIDGRERTEREFAQLFASAGFALERVVPTAGPVSVLEARPVDTWGA
jgi:hypothetical protein